MPVKYTVDISQKFLAFSECVNFIKNDDELSKMKKNLMRKNILQKLFHPIMSSQSNMKYDPELAKTKRYNVATG